MLGDPGVLLIFESGQGPGEWLLASWGVTFYNSSLEGTHDPMLEVKG